MQPDVVFRDKSADSAPSTDSTTTTDSATNTQFSNEHIAMLAEALTCRPRETRTDIQRMMPATDKAQLQERARDVLHRLKTHSATWRQQLDMTTVTARRMIRALGDDDYQQLASLGINLSYIWLDDLLLAAITGAPLVGIETVGPYAIHHLTDAGINIQASQLPDDERAGLLLAGMFRDVFSDCPNVRGVALLDDYTSSLTGRELSAVERDRYVVEIADIFRDFGAIRTNDIAGKDYVLVRESELVSDVDELIQRLRESSEGAVETTPDGDVIFHPSEVFVEKLALISGNRKRELRRRGILLLRQGKPTCQALDAASFLYPSGQDILHVVMLDQFFESQQDKTYALIRALDIVTQDQYHNLFYDAERLPPKLIAFAICEVMIEQTRKVIKLLERVDDWGQFDPDEYVTRNYGSRILPEDRSIINFVAEQLTTLGIPLGRAKLVADIGSGPNLYPSMILAPYVATDGAIDMIEYNDANRAYIRGAMVQTPYERSRGIWNKFEELMIGAAGEHYLGTLDRACDLGEAIVGSIYSLPKRRYDIVTSYFVSESITNSRREFRRGIRSIASAIKEDGLLIVAHMVGSREWHAGVGTHFPAVELSVEEIAEAYRDAGLIFTLSAIEQQATKARDGYQGMTVVVARHAT